MGDKELDPAIIKATQDTLGKYVKKPPLTEKLLKRPPFRFLMDVFNAFINQTGCFKGLYTPDEQLFENIGNKDDKTRFLQKMIDVVKLTTKKELKIRPSKIVAGQEPENTNELLQLLASIVDQGLEWESAVQQVLGGVEPKPTVKPATTTTTTTAEIKSRESKSKQISPTEKVRKEKRISPQEQKVKKTTEKVTRATPPVDKVKPDRKPKTETKTSRTPAAAAGGKKSSSPSKPTSKPKQQTSTESETMSISPVVGATKVKAESPKAKVEPTSSTPPPPTGPPEVPVTTEEPITKHVDQPMPEPESLRSTTSASANRRSSESSGKSRRSSATPLPQTQPQPRDESEHTSKSPVNNQNKSRRSSALQRQPGELENQSDPVATNNQSSNNTNPEMQRQSTFTRENSKDSNSSTTQRPRTSLRPPSARPASARPGAPRRRDRNVEIVLQPNDQVKMSGISVKVESFADFDDDGENLVIIEDANSHDITNNSEQIMENNLASLEHGQGHLVQQILETQKELVQQDATAANAVTAKDNQLKNLGARQNSGRQMNDLQFVIQQLTKSVNPLGKLMDFIPEDIDAMQLELSMWRDTYTQAATELKRERNLTESATEPLKQQLVQLEATIREYQELVDGSRNKILQHNERILKMLLEQ